MDGVVNMKLDFYKNKKVFITGHTGFKGSWLSRILIKAGADLTGYALKPGAGPNLFAIAGVEKNMRSITGDIRDFKELNKAVKKAGPEIIIHMAAQPLVRDSYKNPVYTYETNVMGTVNILECVRLSKSVRSFVNVTTDKVYENKELSRGYKENDNLCGYDPYSNSKSCSELVTYSYKKSFFSNSGTASVSTARSGNVIGGGDFAADRIIPDCVRAAMKKIPVIVRNPMSIRPYQHVLDCLSGYLLLAQKQYDKKLSGSYNFGPDHRDFINNEALVDLFSMAWGVGSSRVNRHDGGPHETSFLKLDCSKAKKILKWKQKWEIEMAVNKTVEWTKCWADNGAGLKCLDEQIEEYFNGNN
jgi:CDP-glucose 4,6-dehydratase